MKASKDKMATLGKSYAEQTIKQHGKDSKEAKDILAFLNDSKEDDEKYFQLDIEEEVEKISRSSSNETTDITSELRSNTGFDSWMRKNPYGKDYTPGQSNDILNTLYE